MAKFRTGVAIAALMVAPPAMADDCAALKAFNERAPSKAAQKNIPCRCFPVSERMDHVYDPGNGPGYGMTTAKPPAGMQCGNGIFYDKHCHKGVTCFPK